MSSCTYAYVLFISLQRLCQPYLLTAKSLTASEGFFDFCLTAYKKSGSLI